jgi:hypothetical protein
MSSRECGRFGPSSPKCFETCYRPEGAASNRAARCRPVGSLLVHGSQADCPRETVPPTGPPGPVVVAPRCGCWFLWSRPAIHKFRLVSSGSHRGPRANNSLPRFLGSLRRNWGGARPAALAVPRRASRQRAWVSREHQSQAFRVARDPAGGSPSSHNWDMSPQWTLNSMTPRGYRHAWGV